MTSLPPDRSHIATEHRNPRSMGLDRMSVAACVALINEEDATVAAAVGHAGPAITAFIEALAPRFARGGRLIYLGAGTSGRLGVLDASECPPTFQTDPGRVVGIIAGGDGALRRSSEGKEDARDGAHGELAALGIGADDAVVGIAAGGTTPYVLGGVEFAKARGALTAMVVCASFRGGPPAFVDHPIVVETGPEVLTGSTRMKAGTATKMVLNTITTTLMVQQGKCYENLMVDVRATNDKLRDRAARIVSMLTGLGRDRAMILVDEAGGSVKVAVVMHRMRVDAARAAEMLEAHGGRLRDTVERGT